MSRPEIEALLFTYAHAIDSKDFELIRTVFTPDAVIDYTSSGGPRCGVDEAIAWLSASLKAFPVTQHIVTNVRVDGDTAVSYLFNPMGGTFHVGGTYTDRLVRTSEGRRIAERVMEMNWMHTS